MTGYTLESILSIDPNWIIEFKSLLDAGLCELIGSGYTQIIGPLIPSEVNAWNQKLGLDCYKKILNLKPKIALINEMAYSVGIVEHYIDAGYKAIIMEWNNPYRYHKEWGKKWRYYPQIVSDLTGRNIPVIWADSIAFQKFQRYVHGENDFKSYIAYIKSNFKDEDQYFPLYSNDVEIFDFRPGRFSTEANILSKESEWERISNLVIYLQNEEKINMVLPSAVLNGLNNKNGGNQIKLESPEQPIPVKKQEKYNINRWALTGRDDFRINTECFLFAKYLKGSQDENNWKELCYLWSSDFRTHITEKRWFKYLERIQSFKSNMNIFDDKDNDSFFPLIKDDDLLLGNNILLNNNNISVSLNRKKGFAIDTLSFNDYSLPLLGTLELGYYDDISLGADFYSGHAVIETPVKHKITDLNNSDFELHCLDSVYQLKTEYCEENIKIVKKISLNKNHLNLYKKISFTQRTACRIYPFIFTFFPKSWDINSLYFETHNGGKNIERFNLYNVDEIYHADLLSSLISSKHALGATNGIVIIGDKDKRLVFKHDPFKSAMIPTIILKKASDNNLFFRLQYSVQEIDETFKVSEYEVHYNCSLAIKLHIN